MKLAFDSGRAGRGGRSFREEVNRTQRNPIIHRVFRPDAQTERIRLDSRPVGTNFQPSAIPIVDR